MLGRVGLDTEEVQSIEEQGICYNKCFNDGCIVMFGIRSPLICTASTSSTGGPAPHFRAGICPP